MSVDEVTRVFGEALVAQPTAPARFVLYFQQGTEQLATESRALLPAVLEAITKRRSTDVGIVGHTDTVADHQFNYQLGLQRADRVRRELQALGADVSILVVDSHGEDDLLVQTPDGIPEPRNRRVEVTVR
jgi:outer membrane protein OmpA-like peptidoglycan-associated protein